MIPFPSNFEVPKFDKYQGKGDPRDHIREFSATCLEVAHNDSYLMQLFPRSLGEKLWSGSLTYLLVFEPSTN